MLSYTQCIQELESLPIMPTKMPELAPMRRALARLELGSSLRPERNIIVAGTNGKGSVAATLSRLLYAAGQKAGLYTSPHLVSTCERIRVGEQDISEQEFAQGYVAVKEIIQSEGLTHFEALTLIAAHVFFASTSAKPIDWAIWEVGLGGLFDATNAIPHSYCAITRLGLDHQQILGDTLEQIAIQKFGVITPGATVVHSPLDPALRKLQNKTAQTTGCRWIPARPLTPAPEHCVQTPWGRAKLALLGPRAAENTATALTLFEALGFDPSPQLHALAQVRWPGRFSRFDALGFECPCFVSGDHNLQGVQSLVEILASLRESRPWEKLHLVVGICQDKELEPMLQALVALPGAQLYLTQTPFKPLALANYPARFRAMAKDMDAKPGPLLSRIRASARKDDLVVITGSLYLVGQVLAEAKT